MKVIELAEIEEAARLSVVEYMKMTRIPTHIWNVVDFTGVHLSGGFWPRFVHGKIAGDIDLWMTTKSSDAFGAVNRSLIDMGYELRNRDDIGDSRKTLNYRKEAIPSVQVVRFYKGNHPANIIALFDLSICQAITLDRLGKDVVGKMLVSDRFMQDVRDRVIHFTGHTISYQRTLKRIEKFEGLGFNCDDSIRENNYLFEEARREADSGVVYRMSDSY